MCSADDVRSAHNVCTDDYLFADDHLSLRRQDVWDPLFHVCHVGTVDHGDVDRVDLAVGAEVNERSVEVEGHELGTAEAVGAPEPDRADDPALERADIGEVRHGVADGEALGVGGCLVDGEFAEFYRAMFERQTAANDNRAVFLEYAWDMAWCDPCAADPLRADELRRLGVFWLDRPDERTRIAPSPAQDVFVTRLHVRYDAEHFPEDLVFQETGDRQNFQGRYVIRHPFRGELPCDATDYMKAVRDRQEREAETLANLTGWDLEDIRAKIDFIDPTTVVDDDRRRRAAARGGCRWHAARTRTATTSRRSSRHAGHWRPVCRRAPAVPTTRDCCARAGHHRRSARPRWRCRTVPRR